MDPITVAIVAGAGMKAFGSWQSSKAKAKAARMQAKIKKAQAQEMLARMNIQEGRMKEQGEVFKADQTTDYAAGGVQIGTGATLIALEDTNMKITQQIDDMKRDVTFKVNQLMMGAKMDKMEASSMSSAGAIMAGGSLLDGGIDAYKVNK